MRIAAPGISRWFGLGRRSPFLAIASMAFGLWAGAFSATLHAQSCTIDQTSTRTGTRIVIDLQTGCTSDAQTTFGAAALYWADYLYSQVPISVEANFQPLSCNATQGTLGSAGPNQFAVNFAGAPRSQVYYPIALANSLEGVDLSTAVADIGMAYNSNIGNPGCIENASWFYDDGTSTSIPANTFDLFGVIQHELGHGLGVISLYGESGIFGSDDPSDPLAGFTDSYSQFLYSETFAQDIDDLSPANRAGVFTSVSGLTWSGSAVDGLAGTLSAGTANNNVRMYAPSPYASGSSVSHFDTAVEPSDLMEPFKLARSVTNFDLTRNLLRDVGWQTLPDPPTISATGTSTTSLTFAVTPPNQTGGSAILNYTLTCGSESTISSSSTITVTGLAANTQYSCRAVTTTGIGTSDTSETLLVTTDAGAAPGPSLAEALDAPTLSWTTGGDANWQGQTAKFVVTGDNDDAAESGAVTDGQLTYLETQVTGPGLLSFFWQVSSEANFDFLEFYLDGTLQQRISGEVNWYQESVEVAGEGAHTLRWVYTKDPSVTSGDDMGWVDLVSYGAPPDAPVLSQVTTEQTSASSATATVSFAPASSGATPQGFTATCTPQSTALGAVVSPLTNSEALAGEMGFPEATRSKQEQEALREFHSSQAFIDQGLRCATDLMQPQRTDVDVGDQVSPELQARQQDCSSSFTQIDSAYDPIPGANYVIPVVFHIISRTDGVGEISDQRVQAQMAVLNEDFAGALGAGVDTGIQFVLADTQRYVDNTAFQDNLASSFKASIAYPQTQYLNVFTNDAGGGGVLGYATLPQGAAGSSSDGIVMLHNTIGGRNNGFGNFDEGRTLVHEVGHYLGLRHTFNPQGACLSNTYTAGDYIVDTPAQLNPDSSAPSSDCGSPSAFDNFMNYSDDRFMDTFTGEQTNRMICSLTSYRSSAYTLVYDNGPPVSASGAASPLTITGLQAGTTYDCAVTALVGSTESGPSSSITILAGDSDGDGALDFDDAFPDDPTETTDTDGDGLGDNLETSLGTDINNVDTDGDGFTDFEEYTEGSDPLDPDDPPPSGLPIWLLYEALQP